MKPGDVVRTRAGVTVEVVNTDAEGRLILCDALDYAVGLAPEAMVDCATLTGAVVVGLGNHAMAVLGTDQALVDELRAVGEATGERCWQLPLWPEYRKQLESETADVKNVGEAYGGAGAPYAQMVFRHQVSYCLALHRWRQSFRWIKSFRALFSSAVSAYICFRREFSCSRSFIRLRSDGWSPPYFDFHW